MSIQINIPAAQSFALVTENQFPATFNAITPGKYDFASPVNKNVRVLELEPRSIYIIERINFSCNIPELDFQDVQTPGQVIKSRFTLESTGNMIFLDPTPFINYYDNLEVYQAFKTFEEDDFLLSTFTGQLDSNFNIAGKLIVSAFLQLNIYRVQSTEWVKRFDDQKLNSGADLLTY